MKATVEEESVVLAVFSVQFVEVVPSVSINMEVNA